jgi:hypothetical protein
MPIFLDRHDLSGMTAEDIAEALVVSSFVQMRDRRRAAVEAEEG